MFDLVDTSLRMAAMKHKIRHLVDMNVGRVCFDEPLKNHCTWKIGGPADVLVEPGSVEQITVLRRYLHEQKVASLTIGQGSNLLFDDAGFRGVVVKVGRSFSAVDIDGETVTTEAGASAVRLARQCGLAGLSGLEHIVGIPGTLGGLVAMNGGSLRQGIGDVVVSLEAMDKEGQCHSFMRDACGFAYRTSIFQDSDWLILRATLRLRKESPNTIHARMLEILRERREKFPRRLPNCGSVFLSTEQMHATIGPPGKVIEETGLKGTRIGDAEVSTQHANFIINRGNAGSEDVCRLVRLIREKVYARTGFRLQCEARKVTPAGNVVRLDCESY